MNAHIYRTWGKRAFDIVVAFSGLILLSPILLAISFLVLRDLGRPILFRQERPGKNGRVFLLLKFRTMNLSVNEVGNLRPDNERMTPFGQRLRATSLDELPELWNVIKGDMSLVGPRPLLPEYLSLYSAHQARRHEVRPGITGLAQVNGRNHLAWQQKFNLDVHYVDAHCLKMDSQILLKTILTVIGKHGVTAENHVSNPPFEG